MESLPEALGEGAAHELATSPADRDRGGEARDHGGALCGRGGVGDEREGERHGLLEEPDLRAWRLRLLF